jgi:TP901 family phage tail tape measure protein
MAESISIDVIFNAINKSANVFSQVNRGFSGVLNNMWKINQAAEGFDRMANTIGRISAPGESYDFGLKELSAITGIAGQDLTDLGKIAREVGKDSGLGATGALEAYKLLASQIEVDKIGLKGLNALQKDTIELAQGSKQLGLAGAANAIAGTLNQFGYAWDQSNRVKNVLAAGSKYGAAEVPDLAASFKVVGASASAAGLQVEDTAGAIEVLSKNNLKGSEAGTAFRNVLLKMQTELGFDFKVTKLSDALATLQGREGDAAYMSKIFGMENMTAAQFLVKNADAVEEMTKKVTGTTVATEQANIMNKTFTHWMDVQKAKLNDLSIGFFQHNQGLIGWVQIGGQAAATFTALSPMIAGTGKVITGSVSGLLTFTKASRLMNAAVAAGKLDVAAGLVDRYGAAGRFAAIGIKIKSNAVAGALWVGKLFNAETRRATLLQLWNGIVSKAQAAWTWTLAGAQKIATGATWLWSRAMAVGGLTMKGVIATTWAWTAALWANPITWIVAGVMALVAALLLAWKHFDWFRGGIVGAWEAVKKFGQILWAGIIEPFKLIFAGIGKLVNAFQLFKKGDLTGAKEAFKGGFGDIGKGVVQSTPIGVAMNVVKRKDEIGQAWNTGYDKGKAIDTTNFLNFGKPQPDQMPDLGNMGGVMPKNNVVEMWPQMNWADSYNLDAQVNPEMQWPDLGAMNMEINPDMKKQLAEEKYAATLRNRDYNIRKAVAEGKLPESALKALPEIPVKINPQMQWSKLGAQNNPFMNTPSLPGLPQQKLTNNVEQLTNNDYLEQLTRNVTENTYNSTVANERSQESRIEVNYQPQVHISAAMTQEDRDAVMKILATDKDKLMKLIKEELRKEGRLSYAG